MLAIACQLPRFQLFVDLVVGGAFAGQDGFAAAGLYFPLVAVDVRLSAILAPAVEALLAFEALGLAQRRLGRVRVDGDARAFGDAVNALNAHAELGHHFASSSISSASTSSSSV